MDKYKALKKYFGYTSFRDGQEEIIDSICSGKDTLGVLPTGSGKSVCYQIPAVIMKGVTVVASPLISLMNDQVQHLAAHGIKGVALNSLMPKKKIENIYKSVRNGEYKLLYVAPERLFNDGFLKLCASVRIPLVVIDEAHCVSQWGKDFRPEYLRIGEFISKLPKRPCVAAFTASATPEIRDEIENILGLNSPLRVVTGFDRPNLYFDVIRTGSKLSAAAQILREKSGCKIVYCSTRRDTDEMYKYLVSSGFNATEYHAGMESVSRLDAREKFISGEKEIIVATNAFGMGIDKPDVRLVLHCNMPSDPESYYQQAGRAGRDGKPSECIMLYSPSDRRTHEFLIEKTQQNAQLDDEKAKAHKAQRYGKLDAMQQYCQGEMCYRKFILDYFGQKSAEKCGYCGYCRKNKTAERVRESNSVRSTDKDYLAALKKLRNETAKRCHIPARLFMSDAQLKKIVKFRPDSFDKLEKYCLFSTYQIKKIGIDIIKISRFY